MRTLISPLLRRLSFFLIATLLALPVAAQQSSSPDASAPEQNALQEAGLTPAEVDDLIAAIEDPAARAALVKRLKGLKAVSGGASSGQAADTGRAGSRLVEMLSERIDSVSEELVAGAALVLDAPRLAGWFRTQVTNSNARAFWLAVLWQVLAVLAAGLVVEWVVRRLLARPRSAIEGQDRDSLWLRLPFLVVRTVLDVVPIAAFAAAGYLVLPLLEPMETTRLVAITLINASVIARVVVAVARMALAPRAATLRLFHIDDENANYVMLWVRRFTNIGVYGYFLAETSLLLGIPFGGYVALTKVIGLLMALLLVVFTLQNRDTVAHWIGGNGDTGMASLRALRRRLADIWHVFAVIYIGAVYIVWVLEIRGGFEFVFRATAISIVVIVAAKLLTVGAHRLLDRGFGLQRDLIEQYPGLAERANRYLAVVNIAVSALIAVLAVLAILEAWGLEAFGWVGTGTGRQVIGSAASIAIVLAIAVFLWEMVSSVVERYLAREAKGGAVVSARAKTLLPLLRKAVLILIVTVVGFIVLSELGVNIGPLLAGAGVIGLAVGFGSQALVKDIITGIFILAEDQFAVGDVISVGGKSGTVEDITIRTIRLRDLAGNVHIIPFSSVSTVENMTKEFSRYVFDVGVAYREDVDEVIEALRALGGEFEADETYGPLIREPLEILGLNSLGDSAVVIRARYTTDAGKQWQVGREFNRRIKHRFDDLGIEIPFPHQTVYFGEDKDGGAPAATVRVEDERKSRSDTLSSSPRPVPAASTDAVDNVTEDGD